MIIKKSNSRKWRENKEILQEYGGNLHKSLSKEVKKAKRKYRQDQYLKLLKT